ncbi:hypothetical protein MycrhDRAFT_5563 [Mycolicibacterium rhodesiae JS60]|nr:hypothetical protein MycrhDRAFT_5563 [Mycolicibacterium rhodesiae JS60]
MTATTAATQHGPNAQTAKTSIRAVAAAAVALTAGAILFAAPEADAMPIGDRQKECVSGGGTWARAMVQGGPGRTCTQWVGSGSERRQYQDRFTLSGQGVGACYRFSVETAWVCV